MNTMHRVERGREHKITNQPHVLYLLLLVGLQLNNSSYKYPNAQYGNTVGDKSQHFDG